MEIQLQPNSLDSIRERIKRMTDDQLLRYGQAAKYMCSPKANMGKPPLETFVIQLREAREEWRRRHTEVPLVDSL